MTSPEDRLKELFTPLGGIAAPEAPAGGSPEDRMAQMFTPLPGYSAYSAASSDAGFVEPETASFAPEEKPKEDKGFFGTAWDWTKGAASGVASGFAGLGGDVRQLTELGVEKGVGLFSEKGAKKVRELSQSLEEQISDKPWLTSFFGAAAGPTSSQAEEGIKELTGYEPKTAGERISQKAGEFVGGSLILPGGTTAKGILSMAAAGAAGEAAKELGGGVKTQLGASILGGILGHKIPGAISGAAKLPAKAIAGELPKSAQEVAAAAAKNLPLGGKVTEKQINAELVSLSKKYNIDLPASALIDNPTLKYMQTVVDKAAASGSTAEKAFKSATEAFVSNFDEAINVAKKEIAGDAFEASNILSNSIKETENFAKEQISNLYEPVSAQSGVSVKNLTPLENVYKEAIESVSRKTARQLEGKEIQAIINEMDKTLESLKSQPKTLISDITRERTDFRNILKNVTDENAKFHARKFYDAFTTTLENLEKEVPPQWVDQFKKANEFYADFKNTFDPKKSLMISAYESKKLESLFSTANSVSALKDLKKVLKYHPNAEQIYKEFAQAKLENIFRDSLIQAGEGKLKPVGNLIRKTKKQEYFRELLGPEKYKQVEELGKLAPEIDSAFRKFTGGAIGDTKALFIQSGQLYSAWNFAKAALSLNPAKMAMYGAGAVTPKVMSELLYDKKFIDYLLKMGKVAKMPATQNNSRLFQALAIGFRNEIEAKIQESGQQEGETF